MKRICLVGATMAALLLAPSPAEAGRRVRRAVRTTAIVAAATTGTAAVVAATPRRTTVVAAAVPVVVPARARVVVVGAPDLTITQITADGDALCITVVNAGTAPAPTSRLQIDLVKPGAGIIAGQRIRIAPLAVNQSVRLRLRSAPTLGLDAQAYIDPQQEVAELDEQNNDLAMSFAAPPAELTTLEAEIVWGEAID